MAYLLDANVFIEAKNRYYGFDFCPAFWDWIVAENASARVFSVQRIGSELEVGSDELAEWAKLRGASFFLSPDSDVLRGLARVSTWVAGGGFTPAAVSTFLDGADYYLVGHALAHGHTVVTHERPDGAVKRIKIPGVCIPLGVRYLNPFEMLRHERATFVLGHSR